MSKEMDMETLVGLVEDQADALTAIQKSLSKLSDSQSIDFSDMPAPVVNVAAPIVNVPPSTVTVIPPEPMSMPPHAKHWLSTVKRDAYGLILTIETVVLE